MYNLAQLLVILLIYLHSPVTTMATSTSDNDVLNVGDRRDQVPLSATPDRQVQGAGNLDEAVNKIVQEQDDGSLLDAHQGISGDKDGKHEQRGIVFANSHNDEMQKEPFVSPTSSCLSRLRLLESNRADCKIRLPGRPWHTTSA